MQIPSTIQQINKTNSQNAGKAKAANKGTNNNANNSAAVAQSPRGKTDTVTLSKKSLTLASKTAAKSVEHRLGVSPVTKETSNQSSDNGNGNGEGSGNSSAVSSMFSLSSNFSAALNSYKDAQSTENESKEAVGTLA